MLCLLADEFPPFVARFLQRSYDLRRRFREETVTDLLMGSLITAGCEGDDAFKADAASRLSAYSSYKRPAVVSTRNPTNHAAHVRHVRFGLVGVYIVPPTALSHVATNSVGAQSTTQGLSPPRQSVRGCTEVARFV